MFDPWVDNQEVQKTYGITVKNNMNELEKYYSSIILAVGHDYFLEIEWNNFRKENSLVYDIKGILPLDQIDYRL